MRFLIVPAVCMIMLMSQSCHAFAEIENTRDMTGPETSEYDREDLIEDINYHIQFNPELAEGIDQLVIKEDSQGQYGEISGIRIENLEYEPLEQIWTELGQKAQIEQVESIRSINREMQTIRDIQNIQNIQQTIRQTQTINNQRPVRAPERPPQVPQRPPSIPRR